MKNQILRPDIILADLSKKAEMATRKTRELYLKSFELVDSLKNTEKIILFSNDTLKVPAERYQNVLPKPHYFIIGMEFITGIRHNNCFDKNSQLWVPVIVRLLIEYDTKSMNYNASMEPLFYCSIEILVFEEKEYNDKRYGILKFPNVNEKGWDNELLIDNFEDFKKLKGVFTYGCKKIGMINLSASITNKNLIELG
jgi:hypothetical protein